MIHRHDCRPARVDGVLDHACRNAPGRVQIGEVQNAEARTRQRNLGPGDIKPPGLDNGGIARCGSSERAQAENTSASDNCQQSIFSGARTKKRAAPDYVAAQVVTQEFRSSARAAQHAYRGLRRDIESVQQPLHLRLGSTGTMGSTTRSARAKAELARTDPAA